MLTSPDSHGSGAGPLMRILSPVQDLQLSALVATCRSPLLATCKNIALGGLDHELHLGKD